MLSSAVKQHQAKQHARRDRQEKRKKEAIVASSALTHALVDHLNGGVAQAYVNQKKLDTETKILQANASQFCRQTTQWLKLVDDFNTALKELGDVENWAKSIETDMRTISSALEYAYTKSE
ncbi:biogenesis of lysosome-related organelles complex 1 subunit 1-like [Crassostrea angulata]|uniref:Biogenesis of lysosome-related organelles complex 1 subunit 1 n=2 Tax=Magallana gigas TaxID=29159 RepID=A0A8W8MB00_MAGGI|nr:biogenesis of lysosome-related organelles complex 1 subunit 1 [Crassostrea gigas]XP_052681842.1 biogenesis of lysosome-related organelles complex 1 subunit 1-like [Crassostrea angulata]